MKKRTKVLLITGAVVFVGLTVLGGYFYLAASVHNS